MDILRPKALKPGSTIGVFTASSPAYVSNPGLFENGLKNLEELGFKTKLGYLTGQRASQGYRSGSPEDRAKEFMDLIKDPEVDALMAAIGGMNSSSLIPYLDYELIRKSQKIICGFSDITSLHLAILKYAGLSTIYGPSVMCWFGDWPDGVQESAEWFLDATMRHKEGRREIKAPSRWSNHARRWDNGDWKSVPREWQTNEGWKILNPGKVEAPILALNLNTLMSAAGTPYWPDMNGKILLLEDMEAPMGRTERSLRQLSLMGVFDQISGLLIGKPEVYQQQGAPFGYDEIWIEVIGPRNYPVVSNFDCSHTVPMISIPQLTTVRLSAERSAQVSFDFLDAGVA